MIKLIATDMDGTLLDDNKQLPENFDNIVKRLFNKNIRFVISSGRSYCTLKKQFSEYLDDMTFICDNGAYVVDKGKLLSVSVLPKDTVKEAVRFCRQIRTYSPSLQEKMAHGITQEMIVSTKK